MKRPCDKSRAGRLGKRQPRLFPPVLILVLVAGLAACRPAGDAEPDALEAAAGLPALTMAYLELAGLPRDTPLVEAEINRRFAAAWGYRLRLLPLAPGLEEQQINYLYATGTPPDLFMAGGTMFSVLVGKNRLLPLDQLLAGYGPNIRRSVDPLYLKAGRVVGTLYGIPSIRDLASDYGVLLRRDILEQDGLDPSAIRNLADLERVLLAVKGTHPGLVPLVIQPIGFAGLAFPRQYDSLGDDLGILADLGGILTVSNLFEHPAWTRLVGLMRSWYLRGLILADSPTNQESVEDLLKSGEVFAALYHQKPGFAGQESRIAGQALVAVSLTPAVATTDRVSNVLWSIPRGSRHPELAMRLLDRLYADPDLVNLLDWGIEGRHYVKLPDGSITFPSGVDAATSGFNPNHGWLFGNQFLSHVFHGDDPGLWQETARFNREAIKSPAFGFSFDPGPVRTEYTAVQAVVATYRRGLECGALDPARVLPLFRSSLRTAGIDRIIAEKQRQLDLWARQSAATSE